MLLIRMIVLAGAFAFVATACGPVPTTVFTPTPTASATPTRPATPTPTRSPLPTSTPVPPPRVLRIGLTAYPNVLDPQKAASGIEIEVLRLLYEGLVTVDEKGNVLPGAADSWELSKDGMQMTFHIRDGLRRVDGSRISASDFEYALKRALDPRIRDRADSFLLFDIRGAQELDNSGAARLKPEDIDKALDDLGIRATGDRTLVLTFKRPTGYWQSIAGTAVTFPTDKKQVDRDPDKWWSKTEGQNGNGPFVVRSMDPGKRIVLVSNPNYWRGRPKLDRIDLLFYPNPAAALDAYKKGEIDIDTSISSDDIAAISADSSIASDLLRYPAAITYAVGFNNARKPFDDKNVRVAFSEALDREGWISSTFKGIGRVSLRWIPPGVPGAQMLKHGVPDYDPRAAVVTLADNGYGTGDSTAENPKVDCAKLGDIKLTYVNSPLNQSRYQFLADDFSQVFGCPITLDPVDYATLKSLSKDAQTSPMIFFQGYLEDYAHPQDWLSAYWVCSSPFAERAGYCNKDLDALLANADQEADLPQAIKLYQQAEDMLIEDVPAAFSHYSENIYLMRPYVLGPREHTGSADTEWPGEWGPVWDYDVKSNHS